METYTDTYGNHWSTDSCLTFGPYGGGGSVACANLRWIERQRNISVMPSQRVRLCGKYISFGHCDDDFSDYDVVMVPGAFGGRTAFINMAGDLRENMDALSITLSSMKNWSPRWNWNGRNRHGLIPCAP